MPDIKEKDLQALEEEEKSRLFELARKIVLASIGAVGLAQDEIEDFVDRLVDRGEIAEKDARKLMREVTEKRRKKAVHQVDKQIERVADRMNIPTKSDIEALSNKIATLTAKVDGLKKAKAHA